MNSTEPRSISHTDDVIDSRDVIARIEYLSGMDDDEFAENEEEFTQELVALQGLADEASVAPDWQHGETLIHDSYFEDYARELAEDIGSVPRDGEWPTSYIDWERAADALRMDYFSVDFDGQTYWVRS